MHYLKAMAFFLVLKREKKKNSLEIALMRRTGITHRPFYPLRKANDSLFLYALFL